MVLELLLDLQTCVFENWQEVFARRNEETGPERLDDRVGGEGAWLKGYVRWSGDVGGYRSFEGVDGFLLLFEHGGRLHLTRFELPNVS